MTVRLPPLALCMMMACTEGAITETDDPSTTDAPTIAPASSSSGATPAPGTTSTAADGSSTDAASSSSSTTNSETTDGTTTETGTQTGSDTETDTETTGGMAECEPTNPAGVPLCGDGTVVAGEVCYQLTPPLQSAGTFTRRVWAGDLDGDDDPDALVLVTWPAAMSVLLNDGLGTLVFDDSYDLVAGANIGPTHVDVEDMNGDGWVDAVVAFTAPPSLLVLTNDGGGAFGVPIELPLPQEPFAVAIADLDDDGWNDAVVSDIAGLTVHYGLGNGSFGGSASFSDPALVDARALAVHDFDGDGDPDVAATYNHALGVFLNDGGTLLPPLILDVVGGAQSPKDLTVGDVSGDGIADLVAVMGGPQVLVGVGDGTFGPPFVRGGGGYAVLGDANADCVLDIFARTAPLMLDELTIYPADGMGGVDPPHSFLLHSGMADMAGADFNGDTLTDILFAIGPSGNVGISLSQP
ncbi:MAG: VCBS repeat-containing protein [Nannocystaceae bacterium]